MDVSEKRIKKLWLGYITAKAFENLSQLPKHVTGIYYVDVYGSLTCGYQIFKKQPTKDECIRVLNKKMQ